MSQIILTETIPDDIPDWAIKAMAEKKLFQVTFDRIKALESGKRIKLLEACVRDFVGAKNNYRQLKTVHTDHIAIIDAVRDT